MKPISVEIQACEFRIDEIQDEFLLKLIEKAREAVDNAYAPYSKFKVGAAISLDNEMIIQGNNQENAAFPSGLCAERVAIFSAGSKYPKSIIKEVAIAYKDSDENLKEPIFPCGSCRQSMLEYEFRQNKDITIYLIGSEKLVKVSSVKDLLPFSFTADFLKR